MLTFRWQCIIHFLAPRAGTLQWMGGRSGVFMSILLFFGAHADIIKGLPRCISIYIYYIGLPCLYSSINNHSAGLRPTRMCAPHENMFYWNKLTDVSLLDTSLVCTSRRDFFFVIVFLYPCAEHSWGKRCARRRGEIRRRERRHLRGCCRRACVRSYQLFFFLKRLLWHVENKI